MANKNKNIQKLKSLISDKPSAWKEKAEYRKSRPWLKAYSSQIARRIVAIINDGDKEINQTKLAEALGVRRQQVSKIIKGEENLTLESIYKLSRALNYELISFPPYKYNVTKSIELKANSDLFINVNVSLYMANALVVVSGSEEGPALYSTKILSTTTYITT